MKRKTKLAFEELESELRGVERNDMLNYLGGFNLGGSGVSWDCVFRTFDYLDGSGFTAEYYDMMTKTNLYYSASGNGGVNPSDIPAVGGFGYMSVTEVQPDILNGFSNGKTSNGNNLAVLIPGATPNSSHMVVVTGIRSGSGYQVIDYYDPTLNTYSAITVDNIKAGYEIGNVGSNPTPWLNSGN